MVGEASDEIFGRVSKAALLWRKRCSTCNPSRGAQHACEGVTSAFGGVKTCLFGENELRLLATGSMRMNPTASGVQHRAHPFTTDQVRRCGSFGWRILQMQIRRTDRQRGSGPVSRFARPFGSSALGLANNCSNKVVPLGAALGLFGSAANSRSVGGLAGIMMRVLASRGVPLGIGRGWLPIARARAG